MTGTNKTIKRILQFDLIRILAICLVIIVHTQTIPDLTTFSWNQWPLYGFFFLGKLGVPLFVMLSGALLLNKQESPMLFYKKRFARVVIPWLFWSAVYFCFKLATNQIEVTTFTLFFKEFFIVALSDFWFMPMIILLYGVTPYVRSLVQNSLPLLHLLTVWFLLTSLLPALYLSPLFPGSSSTGLLTLTLSFLGYFIIGWCLRQYKSTFSFLQLTIVLVASLALYLCLGSLYASNENKLFFAFQDYFSPPLIIGSTALFMLLLKIKKLAIKKQMLIILSNLSFGIFLSHVLIANVLFIAIPVLEINAPQSENLFFSWLIRAVLVYSISALLIWSGTQISFLKKLIA